MYLDYAASTPISYEVKKKILEVINIFGNPSSQHSEGFKAKSIINESSAIISNIIKCEPSEIHYTSGATMSNNLAIQGFIKATNGILITTKFEHDDILLLSESLPNVYYVPCDEFGRLKCGFLDDLIFEIRENTDSPILVSIQSANGETGVIQDINKISKIIHRYRDCYFHTDATQYIAHKNIDLSDIDIDMLSMSGQKIGCIKGVGLLYVKGGTPLSSIIYGDQGLIGGTENVLGIACLGTAFLNKKSESNLYEKQKYLADRLKGKLIGKLENRLPNNIMMLFNGVSSEMMVSMLNEYGICVSGGSACSSNSDKPSSTLLAMGYSEEEASSCIRITIPDDITYLELDEAIDRINECYRILKEY